MPQRRFLLDESEIPTHWYNVAADLASPPPPPLHPATAAATAPTRNVRRRTREP